MKVLFWILVALWVVAVGVWMYTMINRRTRDDFVYIYSMIALLVLNVVIQIVNLIMKIN